MLPETFKPSNGVKKNKILSKDIKHTTYYVIQRLMATVAVVTTDGGNVFMRSFLCAASGCSSSSLCLRWTFICCDSRSAQSTAAAFFFVTSLFINLFLYFLVASLRPTLTVFSALCSLTPAPLHSPLFISTEQRKRPDVVRKHFLAVRKAAAACRVLVSVDDSHAFLALGNCHTGATEAVIQMTSTGDAALLFLFFFFLNLI